MKSTNSPALFSLVLICLLVTAAGADPVAGIYSVAADTSGPPPQEASVYISHAKEAVDAGNWTGAILVTTRGLAWYPNDPELLCLQAYSYRKTGEYQKAVDIVSRAIPLDPRAVRYANRGYGYLALGNYSAALMDAEAGITQDPSYTTNYGVKALALQGLSKNPEAVAAIDTAIAQSPDSAHYWHIKGRVLSGGGDCSGAAAALEKSIALDPDYTLPYPSFGTAREDLADLNTTCRPPGASPGSTRASAGIIAAIGCLGAVIAVGMKR